MREDFPKPVKRILAARVSYRCSNPSCRASTSGPQLDDDRSVSIGVAAHITAAASGGPRFDTALTPKERIAIDNAIWLCQNCAKTIDSDISRYSVQVLHQWKRQAEQKAFEEVGKTMPRASAYVNTLQNAEEEIRRKLELRDTLRRALVKPYTAYEPPRKHQYEGFHIRKLIIRSLEDRSYPSVDVGPGISGWFRVEPFDFYHNGLEVILGLHEGIISEAGDWKIIEQNEKFNQEEFRRKNILLIGLIPFSYIRAYDLHGDEFYNEPHLYCAFANNGEPYEDFRYVLAGGKDEYDWPLDSKKQIKSPVKKTR